MKYLGNLQTGYYTVSNLKLAPMRILTLQSLAKLQIRVFFPPDGWWLNIYQYFTGCEQNCLRGGTEAVVCLRFPVRDYQLFKWGVILKQQRED